MEGERRIRGRRGGNEVNSDGGRLGIREGG